MGQQKPIRDLRIGWRSFEMDMPGSNPLSIAPLMKDPVAYLNLVSRFPYDGLSGNPAPVWVQQGYLSIEWRGKKPDSRFWARHGLVTGLYLTQKTTRSVGSLSRTTQQTLPALVVTNVDWSLQEYIRFAGGQVGLLRRIPVARQLHVVVSLEAQGGWAVQHGFTQHIDSGVYRQGQPPQVFGRTATDLAGKRYFQWQLMLPLALEANIYRQRYFLRLAFIPGLVGGPQRAKGFAANEAHGFGLSLHYRPGS